MVKKTLSAITLLVLSSSAWAGTPANTLTVYTYGSFASEWGPGPAIKKAFEKKYDCTLNYVALDDGVSILNRLRMEGKNTQADVILGLDSNLMIEAEQTGLLAKSDVDTSNLTVPNGWHNPYFVPYDYGYFAFIYDSTKLKNPPTSMAELLSRKDISVIYEDPRTSTPGQGLLLWMKDLYGNKASTAWQQLAKKTVTVTKSWSEAYNMFLNGESDMVLSYTTSPAYHIMEEHKYQYKAADFKEGNYLQVEVAARLNTSKHPKLAKEFMQFIISPAFQSQIPTGNWMYPVIKERLPKAFEQLPIPTKALEIPQQQVAKQRLNWIREWQQALIQ